MRIVHAAGIFLAVWVLGTPAARAVITINTQFAELFKADGIDGIGAGKVGILVVDEGTTPGLADPRGTVLTAGSYLGGSSDDRIIGVALSVANVASTGYSGFDEIFPSIVYDGNFEAGDKLYFLWFPTITGKGDTVGASIEYGAYRSDVVNDASGSDIAFIAPPDGFSGDLFVYLNSIASGSGVTKSDFTAKLVTAVPEPSTLWLLAAAGAGWLIVRGRVRRRQLPLVVAAGLLAASSVQAQIWNAASGDWATSANWVDDIPESGDNTYIGNNGTATVGTGTTAFSYGSLNIAGQPGTPSTVLVQNNATLNASGGAINLGYSQKADLSEVFGPGNLQVTGFQAQLINAGALHVGVATGAGHLLINGGGTVTSTSGTMGSTAGSTAVITGGGSKWTAGGLAMDSNANLTVASGGELILSSGVVTVGAGATIRGNGTISGAVTLNGTISTNGVPGTLTTGAQTWGAGGKYSWFVNDADPLLTPGISTSWSRLFVNGALTIDSTSLTPFIIDLHSLTSGNADGNVVNFTPGANQSWVIATATGGVESFLSDKFLIEDSAFFNERPGVFSISVDGDNLMLNYAAIPEVSATGVGSVSLLVLAILTRRRFFADPIS